MQGEFGDLELFHVLYPSGEHELRTIRRDGPNETSGRCKFHEMAHLDIPFYGIYVGNACHMQLPEVFRMQATNEVR